MTKERYSNIVWKIYMYTIALSKAVITKPRTHTKILCACVRSQRLMIVWCFETNKVVIYMWIADRVCVKNTIIDWHASLWSGYHWSKVTMHYKHIIFSLVILVLKLPLGRLSTFSYQLIIQSLYEVVYSFISSFVVKKLRRVSPVFVM